MGKTYELKPFVSEWLKEIPNNWNACRFKQAASLVSEPASVNDIKVGLENIESNTGRHIKTDTIFDGTGTHFNQEDVLFGKLRPYLAKVYKAEFSGQAVGDFWVYRAKNIITPDYLQKLMISQDFIGVVNASTYGAKMPRVSWQFIANLSIPIPPIEEQKQITAFLDAKTLKIDECICLRERELQTLNELKQSQIASVVTRGLNPNVPMKDSGCQQIGPIPSHWNVVKMKYCFNQRSEKGYPNEPMLCATQSEGVIPQSMYSNRVVVVNKGFEGLKLVKVGDFVISLRSFQGGIEYAYYQGIISSAYTILTPKDKRNSRFFKYLFKSHPFIQLLQTCVTGIREGQNINYGMLGNNFIPIPPLEEQNAIVDYIESQTSKIDSMISSLNAEIERLKEYKQSLISDVVTGQINVQDEII